MKEACALKGGMCRVMANGRNWKIIWEAGLSIVIMVVLMQWRILSHLPMVGILIVLLFIGKEDLLGTAQQKTMPRVFQQFPLVYGTTFMRVRVNTLFSGLPLPMIRTGHGIVGCQTGLMGYVDIWIKRTMAFRSVVFVINETDIEKTSKTALLFTFPAIIHSQLSIIH